MRRQLIIDGKTHMEAETISVRVGDTCTSYFTMKPNKRGEMKVHKAVTVGNKCGAEVRLIWKR